MGYGNPETNAALTIVKHFNKLEHCRSGSLPGSKTLQVGQFRS
jgi:hypothetical protein